MQVIMDEVVDQEVEVECLPVLVQIILVDLETVLLYHLLKVMAVDLEEG